MNWRGIDNMIASACIQEIQKDIKSGKKKAKDIIPAPGISEDKAKELYNAWRVYFIDRMMKEYDDRHWGDSNKVDDPLGELEYDLQYFNKLVEEENSKKK